MAHHCMPLLYRLHSNLGLAGSAPAHVYGGRDSHRGYSRLGQCGRTGSHNPALQHDTYAMSVQQPRQVQPQRMQPQISQLPPDKLGAHLIQGRSSVRSRGCCQSGSSLCRPSLHTSCRPSSSFSLWKEGLLMRISEVLTSGITHNALLNGACQSPVPPLSCSPSLPLSVK